MSEGGLSSNKVTELDLLKKKSYSGVFGLKGPKIKLLKFDENSTFGIFLIFLHEVTTTVFFGKIICFFFSPNWLKADISLILTKTNF